MNRFILGGVGVLRNPSIRKLLDDELDDGTCTGVGD
jgi:hypothetical protein